MLKNKTFKTKNGQQFSGVIKSFSKTGEVNKYGELFELIISEISGEEVSLLSSLNQGVARPDLIEAFIEANAILQFEIRGKNGDFVYIRSINDK